MSESANRIRDLPARGDGGLTTIDYALAVLAAASIALLAVITVRV